MGVRTIEKTSLLRWTILYDVRTEITETHSLLEGVFSLLRQDAYA